MLGPFWRKQEDQRAGEREEGDHLSPETAEGKREGSRHLHHQAAPPTSSHNQITGREPPPPSSYSAKQATKALLKKMAVKEEAVAMRPRLAGGRRS